jgi:hypothetical protein
MEDLVISDLGAGVLQFAALGLGRSGLCAVHTGAYLGPMVYPQPADYLVAATCVSWTGGGGIGYAMKRLGVARRAGSASSPFRFGLRAIKNHGPEHGHNRIN